MGYGYKTETDETKTSTFNAAAFKMQRLHEIRDKINKLNQFPLGFDELTGEENHLLLFRCLVSLFTETYAKLGPPDRKAGMKTKDTLQSYMEKYPVRKHRKHNGVPTGEIIFSQKNWDTISKALFIYERDVMKYVDKTGMDTPEQDGFDGL